MAIVQSKSIREGADPRSLSFDTLPTAGNTVVVAIFGYASGLIFGTSGCSDNQGNTYTRAAERVTSDSGCAIYYCESIGSPSGTFTVTVEDAWTGSLFGCMTIMEFPPLTFGEANAANSVSGELTATVTIAGAAASEVQVAVCALYEAQASITVNVLSPAWTEHIEDLLASYLPGEIDSRTATVAWGDFTAEWTFPTSTSWRACVATFTSAAATGQFARPIAVYYQRLRG